MDVHSINLFLLHLAIQGLTYSSINNQVSALVGFAKHYRQPIDIRGDYELDLTLKSLKRVLGDAQRKKDELFPLELLQMYQFVDRDNYVEESVWLGVVLLYRTMLRKSHIFSGEFDENLLMRSEIEFFDWGVLFKVNRSKTIQYKERIVQIPVHYGGGKLCLTTLLKDYLGKYPTTPNVPVLARQRFGSYELINYTQALRLFKRWGKSANIKKDIGMHSLRRGSATLMSLAGFQLEDIKDRGDWQSTAVLKYLSYPLNRKIHIDKQIVSFIDQLI